MQHRRCVGAAARDCRRGGKFLTSIGHSHSLLSDVITGLQVAKQVVGATGRLRMQPSQATGDTPESTAGQSRLWRLAAAVGPQSRIQKSHRAPKKWEWLAKPSSIVPQLYTIRGGKSTGLIGHSETELRPGDTERSGSDRRQYSEGGKPERRTVSAVAEVDRVEPVGPGLWAGF